MCFFAVLLDSFLQQPATNHSHLHHGSATGFPPDICRTKTVPRDAPIAPDKQNFERNLRLALSNCKSEGFENWKLRI